MGHGTFEAKFIPLLQLEKIGKIIVVRKDEGPEISKLEYRILPRICKSKYFNLVLTPLILLYYALKEKPDFILAYHYQPHFYFGYLVAKLISKPLVVGQTGTDAQNVANKPFKGSLLRYILKRVYSFNVPGKSTYDFWLNKGVSSHNLRVLHSTINTELFVPCNSKKEYDFIFVGRLTEVKRIDKIIKAVAKLRNEYPNLKICIVGSGHLESELKELAKSKNVLDNFDFVGLQSDIQYWLSRATAFLMTSDSEGLPCAMMEAMSSGLICIGPDVNNMRDLLVEAETGFLFKTNNVDELTNKMKHVTDNLEKLDKIRINARELIVAEHSYKSAKDKWKKVLDRL